MPDLYKHPRTSYFVPVVPDPPTADPPAVPTTRRMPPNRLILLLILLVLTAGVFSLAIRPAAAPSAAPVVVQVPPAAPPPPAPAPEAAPLIDPAPASSDAGSAEDPAVPDASTTPEEIARQYGGSPEQWSREAPGGRPLAHPSWRFRSLGRDALRFTVPYGVVVQTPTGWYGFGEQVAADDLTLFWL